MSTEKSLLSSDAVFVAGVLFHSRGQKPIGQFRLQKIGYLSYVKLPDNIKQSLTISYDETWVGERDLTVDRVLNWLVQSNFALKTPGDVFGDEYNHVYELSYDGTDAYTQLGNTDHVLTRNVEERIGTETVLAINNAVKQTVSECRDLTTEKLVNKVVQQNTDSSDMIDLS